MSWTSPPRAPEAIRWRRVDVAIVVTLTVFGVGVAFTVLAYRVHAAAIHAEGPGVPAPLGGETIGALEQAPFGLEHRAAAQQAEARGRLSTYGWVDRRRGIAHVPIDAAIDALVAREAARGGAP